MSSIITKSKQKSRFQTKNGIASNS